jgi:pyruvate formate lyase activating enzyme
MTEGIVFDVQRYSLQDGPGLRTLVFLKGCPLHCAWCSNPESQRSQPELLYDQTRCTLCGECARVCPTGAVLMGDNGTLTFEEGLCTACGACVSVCRQEARRIAGELMSEEQVVKTVLRDMPFYRRSGGGVTLGGGEPTQQPLFAGAILRQLKLRGVDTATETCGHADPTAFMEVAVLADHVLFDVKHADSVRHTALTGAGNERILANLAALLRRHADVTIRYPLVPGCNDTEAELREFAALVLRLPRVPPVELVPYHRLGEHKYRLLHRDYLLAGTNPHDAGVVNRACGILQVCGVACRSLTH